MGPDWTVRCAHSFYKWVFQQSYLFRTYQSLCDCVLSSKRFAEDQILVTEYDQGANEIIVMIVTIFKKIVLGFVFLYHKNNLTLLRAFFVPTESIIFLSGLIYFEMARSLLKLNKLNGTETECQYYGIS